MSLAALTVLLAVPAPVAHTVGITCDGALHDTQATGFFVGPGIVVTALHAVTGSELSDFPRAVSVTTAGGRRFAVAEVLALDIARDVCLLGVPAGNETWLRPAAAVATGEPVTVLPRAARRARTPLPTRIVAQRTDESGHLRLRVGHPLTRRSGAPAVDREGRFVGMVSTTHELIPAEAIGGLLRRRGAPIPLRDAHLAVARSPHGLLDFAVGAHARGDRRRAAELLQAAVTLQPELAAAHNLLGVVLRKSGRWEEARIHYERAVAIRPSYGPAHFNLGLLRRDLDLHRHAPADRGDETATLHPPPGRAATGTPPPPTATAARPAPPRPEPGDAARAAAALAAAAPAADAPLNPPNIPWTSLALLAAAFGSLALAATVHARRRRTPAPES